MATFGLVAAVVGVLGVSVACADAAAAEPAPAWRLYVTARPTVFLSADNAYCEEDTGRLTDGKCESYELLPTNVGSRAATGKMKLTETLPADMTLAQGPELEQSGSPEWECSTGTVASRQVITCEGEGTVAPLSTAKPIIVGVTVAPSAATTVFNEAEISGGGASPVSTVTPTEVNSAPQPFRIVESEALFRGPAGEPETQAAGHPAGFTASFVVSSNRREAPENRLLEPVEDVRQIVTDFPPGLVGDARSTPTCPVSEASSNPNTELADCSPDTVVGTLAWAIPGGSETHLEIYNVVPEHGYPAEFAVYYPALQRTIYLYASLVGSGANAHVRVITGPQVGIKALTFSAISYTFYGDPNEYNSSPLVQQAFYTMPSDCEAPGLATTLYLDSWEHPGRLEADGQPDLSDSNWKKSEAAMPPVAGCEKLQFHPTLTVSPTVTKPDSPTGLRANLEVPQSEAPHALATPPLKDATVTLPQGLVISPSSATGLEGCANDQIALEATGPGACPPAATIGEVTIHTPLLEEPLHGPVYVGSPECDPCSPSDASEGRMVRLFIDATSPRYGVTIKLQGRVSVNPATGQLTATFDEAPQQPFSSMEFSFKEGPRAPLATPGACGSYETSASLTPWSAPFTPTATSTGTFTIGPCEGGGFTPTFSAGTTSSQAGAYSPFTVMFSRQDREQDLSGVSVTLPPGLLGKVAGIPRCGEAEANAGTCAAASQVGTATAAAGSGPEPLWQSGRAYLTGPYKNAPFGLSVVVPAVAGPYNLGNIVVRAAIYINPTTTQVTVVSDPLPQSIDGIPLRVKTVNVTVGTSGNFTFNPTSCSASSVTATLTSLQGGQANVSSPFEAANCAALPFKPSFTTATQARTSKASGASLTVRVLPGVGQANIAKVSLELPKQLPARLTTLQKACTEAQFDINPAGCPEASDIGVAKAVTPVLNTPLVGPAYLVSHGGAAFPDVEFILQGEGVTIDLDGKTQIKKGVTYSHFETVPDAPISSFETTLPEGPHSVFATDIPAKDKNSLCGLALSMPTTITGQNGAVFKQTTKAAITGCAKAKALTRPQKLAAALKACHKSARRKKECERTARARYGPVRKRSASKKGARRS
jgi:hypothetical protein